MGDTRWVQCQSCGKLYKVNSKYIVYDDDDLYIYLYCPECKGGTKHLDVGEHRDDVYVYGNMSLLGDYYLYNTKQND